MPRSINPPSPGQLEDLVRVMTEVLRAHPPAFTFLREIVRMLWCRYKGPLDEGDPTELDEVSLLDLFTGDYLGDTATLSLMDSWRTMKPAERHAVWGLMAVTRADRTDGERERIMLWGFKHALNTLANLHLRQGEVAELAAFLTHMVAVGKGLPSREHGTEDAASARLQIIADQFAYICPERQQDIAALVAGMANGTPDRAAALRTAVRQFLLREFNADDLTDLAQACIRGIRRKASAGQEQPAQPEAV